MNLRYLRTKPPLKQVKLFWENNPLSATMIDAQPGSVGFFDRYDSLREINEPPVLAEGLHEYDRFLKKRVLEVGCGNSYTLAKYADHGATVHGIDITETAIIISRRRFEHQHLKGEFIVGNAEELPYKSDYFDCICSMGVLHHVPDSEKAVLEIYRCLKPGGRLIVMFYHKDSLLYRVVMPIKSFLTGKSLTQVVNEVDGIGNPKGEVYSKKELRNLLCRFRDIEMFSGLLQPSMLRSTLPHCVVDKLARRWGWFLYAKARK